MTRDARPRAQALGLGIRGPAARRRLTSRRRRPRSASASGFGGERSSSRCRWRRSSCRAPRLTRPGVARRDRHRRPARARHPRARQGLPRRRPRLPRPDRQPARPRRLPARRGRASRRCSAWCAERERRRSPTAAAPASSAVSSRGIGDDYAGAVSVDLGALDRVLEVDRSRARRGSRPARPGRALKEQLAEHGLTLRHFPQSFEYSTLGGWIATRAGGHFATALDPHRRPGRVGARDHPARRLGEPAAAGLRRGAQPGPAADRLRGDPRGDHRGLGAGAASARATSVGRRRLRDFAAGAERRAGARPVRAQPVQLPAARRGRGRAHRRRRRRARRCSCSASSRRTTRWTADGAGARARARRTAAR